MNNNNNIEKLLIKNRILDNDSNKIHKIYYKNFSGEKIINLDTGGYLNNGYVFISVKTSNQIEIYYKNVLVFSSNIDLQKMIPCLFENNAFLKIIGECDEIEILIFGAKNIDCPKNYYLPKNKKIITDCGGVYKQYAFENLEQISSGDLILEKEFDNLISAQSVYLNGLEGIGYLLKEDNLVFITNCDNYANKFIITNLYQDAVIVPDFQNNRVFIFYIYQNKLYYRVITEDLSIGEEFVMNNKFDDVLNSFGYIIISEYSLPILTLNLNNNKTLLMLLKDEKLECKLIKKSNNVGININNLALEIYEYDVNSIYISKYEIIKINNETEFVSNSIKKQICNIDWIMKFDNKYLLFNSKFNSIIYENDIFNN